MVYNSDVGIFQREGEAKRKEKDVKIMKNKTR